MNSILAAAAVYGTLLVIFRLAGNRTLAQITTFDLILLLIISETVQGVLIASDSSYTNAILTILTLVLLDIGLSLVKLRWPRIDRLVDGVPLILLVDGVPIGSVLKKCRVDEQDILSAARHQQGLTQLDEIQYAVLECHGGISIIPKKSL